MKILWCGFNIFKYLIVKRGLAAYKILVTAQGPIPFSLFWLVWAWTGTWPRACQKLGLVPYDCESSLFSSLVSFKSAWTFIIIFWNLKENDDCQVTSGGIFSFRTQLLDGAALISVWSFCRSGSGVWSQPVVATSQWRNLVFASEFLPSLSILLKFRV